MKIYICENCVGNDSCERLTKRKAMFNNECLDFINISLLPKEDDIEMPDDY